MLVNPFMAPSAVPRPRQSICRRHVTFREFSLHVYLPHNADASRAIIIINFITVGLFLVWASAGQLGMMDPSSNIIIYVTLWRRQSEY